MSGKSRSSGEQDPARALVQLVEIMQGTRVEPERAKGYLRLLEAGSRTFEQVAAATGRGERDPSLFDTEPDQLRVQIGAGLEGPAGSEEVDR